jgi:hypothetical protein
VQYGIAKIQTHPEGNALDQASEALFALCQDGDWTTDDPLGVGGLLFDACRLSQLIREGQLRELRLLEAVIKGCHQGLMLLLERGYLNWPIPHRLAFRELGLAIGLRALPIIADAGEKNWSTFESRPELPRTIDLLLPYESLSEDIVRAWLPHAQPQDEIWQAHQDINDVMLATALIPGMFLSVGKRMSSA